MKSPWSTPSTSVFLVTLILTAPLLSKDALYASTKSMKTIHESEITAQLKIIQEETIWQGTKEPPTTNDDRMSDNGFPSMTVRSAMTWRVESANPDPNINTTVGEPVSDTGKAAKGRVNRTGSRIRCSRTSSAVTWGL